MPMPKGNVYRAPDRSKYLLADEIKVLLQAAEKIDPFHHAYLKFMSNTGVRPSESNQVRREDIDTNQLFIKVKTLKQSQDQKEKPRDVDISQDFAKGFEFWLKDKNTTDKLFPRSRVSLWSKFKKAAKAAGLPGTYTLYSLRHSRAIYLLEWTGDIDYVCRQLGHSSIDITRCYLHVLPSKREEYVKTKLGTF